MERSLKYNVAHATTNKRPPHDDNGQGVDLEAHAALEVPSTTPDDLSHVGHQQDQDNQLTSRGTNTTTALFVFSEEHRVIVCHECGTCMSPHGPKAWREHLYKEPHRPRGISMKAALGTFSTYEPRMRSAKELRACRPDRRTPCNRIDGLAAFSGCICVCNEAACDFTTRRLQKMQDHMPQHGKKASQHNQDGHGPLWRACTLQSYFTAAGLLDNFVVKDKTSVPESNMTYMAV